MRLDYLAHAEHALKILKAHSACAKNHFEYAEPALKSIKRMLIMRLRH